MSNSKLLKFSKSDEPREEIVSNIDNTPWQVLVVDDDEAIHEVTRLVLKTLTFDRRSLELTHAYSAQEAQELLSKPNQFAVLLLDVVMENEHAGLDLVTYIRNVLKNQFCDYQGNLTV